MQDPFDVGQHLAELGQVGTGQRVDQCSAGACSTQLDEIGAVAVAIARRTLRVDRDRTLCRAELRNRLSERARVGDDRRQTVARLDQGKWRRGHRTGPPPRGGDRHDAGRQGSEARGKGEHVAPGQGVRGEIRVEWGPRRPDLDLCCGGLCGHRAERLRRDPGDGAAGSGVGSSAPGKCLGQPGPPDAEDERVGSPSRPPAPPGCRSPAETGRAMPPGRVGRAGAPAGPTRHRPRPRR